MAGTEKYGLTAGRLGCLDICVGIANENGSAQIKIEIMGRFVQQLRLGFSANTIVARLMRTIIGSGEYCAISMKDLMQLSCDLLKPIRS